jgi:hypothetical protein
MGCRPWAAAGCSLNALLLLPFIIVQDFLSSGSQCTKAVRTERFLEHVLVGLLSLACACRCVERPTIRLELITGILQHALELNLFGLLAVDVVLELLDHTMGMLERMLQRFRLEHAMTRSSFVWRRRRRVFRCLGIALLCTIVGRRILGWNLLINFHPVSHSLCKLLILIGKIFDFA